MALFADAPVPDFGNRNLDNIVSAAITRFGSEHRDLLSGTRLGVSLVDLTTRDADPPYGGMNDSAEYFVASLAKIGAMYAAYQLRSFVKEQATNFQGMQEELLPSLESNIRPQIEAQIPALPRDHPQLSKIFLVGYSINRTGLYVKFTSTGEDDSRLAAIEAEEDPKHPNAGAFQDTRNLGFNERLSLMIKWSSNCGACTCITDLGFQYINAALQKAGLFDNASSTGIWLGASYASGCPGATRGPTTAVGGGRVSIVNQSAPDERFQVATPRTVARMLRAIAELKLVDADASGGLGGMKDLLDKRWAKTTSPIGFGLTSGSQSGAPTSYPIAIYSKLGIGASTVCDCALITSGDRFTGPVHYIAVVLGARKTPGDTFEESTRVISVLAPYLERSLLDTYR